LSGQADRGLGPTAGFAAPKLPGRARADVLVPDHLAASDRTRVIGAARVVTAARERRILVGIGRILAAGLEPHQIGRTLLGRVAISVAIAVAIAIAISIAVAIAISISISVAVAISVSVAISVAISISISIAIAIAIAISIAITIAIARRGFLVGARGRVAVVPTGDHQGQSQAQRDCSCSKSIEFKHSWLIVEEIRELDHQHVRIDDGDGTPLTRDELASASGSWPPLCGRPSDWRAHLGARNAELPATGKAIDRLCPITPEAHKLLLGRNLSMRPFIAWRRVARTIGDLDPDLVAMVAHLPTNCSLRRALHIILTLSSNELLTHRQCISY
jgi:hypothetical protein